MKFSKVAKNKSTAIQLLIRSGAEIIESVGVPIDDLTPRRIEKMSMCFLALCSITKPNSWSATLSISDKRYLRSREIIEFINLHFEENIRSGSYDDIRRKDLKRLVGMGLVIKSAKNPDADINDGTRGYAIDKKFAKLIINFETNRWNEELDRFESDSEYIDSFLGKREIEKLEVKLEKGLVISLDDGRHNQIQKAIVDKFLPIYGYNATVLYIGDASEKKMHKYSERMIELGLDIEDRGMLPDIIAFSEQKQWVYVIEAVHSSNPLNPERCIELQRTVLRECPYGVVYVTAFLSRKDFAKWMSKIAWETEVWLADTPEHLIHFDGEKFLGPHSKYLDAV